MKNNKFGVFTLALVLAGCGGGGSDEKISTPIPEPTFNSYDVTAIDGYLKNADIWLDINGNGLLDSDEPNATTGGGGRATLQIPSDTKAQDYSVAVRAKAGVTIDESLGRPIAADFIMIAPAGESVITPLSTLVHIEMQLGDTKEAAIQQVSDRLNIPTDAVLGDFIAKGETSAEIAAVNIVSSEVIPSDAAELATVIADPTELSHEVEQLAEILVELEEGELIVPDETGQLVVSPDSDNDGMADVIDPEPMVPAPVEPTPANPTPVDPTPVPTDQSPTLDQTSYSIDEDGILNEALLARVSDGGLLSYELITGPSNGLMTFNIDGSFNYTPKANFNGSDSFIAKVSDSELSSGNVTFNITINSVNDSPTIAAIERVTRLDQPVRFNIVAADADNDELSYRIITEPKYGLAILNDDNTVTYTPTPGAQGEDTFEIEVSDQQLNSAAHVMINNNLAYVGQVNLEQTSPEGIEVILTGDKVLKEGELDANGQFKFYGLPDGDYAVKVRKKGYKSARSQTFNLDIASSVSALASTNGSDNTFTLEPLDSNNFSYHWEEDQSTAGYDYASHINTPVTVEFLNEQIEVVDDSSANHLQHDLNILLVDSADAKWTQEHAYRIAQIMKNIPQQQRDPYNIQSLVVSKWQLTSDFIKDDIQIIKTGEHQTVLISDAVFVNAAPKVAEIEGKRGVFYSQRLHNALVRFVTDNGKNEVAYEKILTERYGVSTLVPDYSALTYPTGNEGSGRFQKFHPAEIVQIINMLEEMPKGLHKLPELKYLIRRLDGTPHPLYFEAPAVAWSSAGYIEFMESAFNTSNVEHMHRLIIHEKTHFLWANQFDTQLKDDWAELGGWYQDVSTTSGWATTKQTEFVSAYAHSKNPNEDMAESISYFIVNPDKLKSRAMGKYEFVRDRIMQGNVYISQIREDLTFQVYNLFPDYVFPGKIKRLDINVDGMPQEDKTVTIEIELHALDIELEGAKTAYMRILSEIGTFTDLYLYPVDQDGVQLDSGKLSTILKGSFTLSKYVKAGFWRTQQIVITDAVGNERMEGANDFGWKLYVNNLMEDVTKPEYVENTAVLTKSTEQREGQEIQIIHATWTVDENNMMADRSPCYASMNDEIISTYRVEAYGRYDDATTLCSVDFVMPHYMPSSTYSMNFISMADQALNKRGTYFTNPNHGLRAEDAIVDEVPQQIELLTTNQDIEQPELDLNDIQISAIPTNPDVPNGETEVTVTFKVRDNNSGYNIASLYLRDPQGISHQFWAYNDATWTLFPTDDPTEWHTYTRKIILPVGSAPGTWGMSEMTIYDRAGNFKGYDFIEIVHFDVGK